MQSYVLILSIVEGIFTFLLLSLLYILSLHTHVAILITYAKLGEYLIIGVLATVFENSSY